MYARAVYRIQGSDVDDHEADIIHQLHMLKEYLGDQFMHGQGTTIEPPQDQTGTFLEVVYSSAHPQSDAKRIGHYLNDSSDLRYECLGSCFIGKVTLENIVAGKEEDFLERI